MTAEEQPALTTTSYAVLGLLCVQPWSAYDLAQQMKRSTRYVWPRASSGVYNEPKKLEAHGYATVRVERTGKRERHVYRATAKGRRAMKAWLKSEATPMQFESEVLLRVWFPDEGNRDDLLSNIDRLGVDSVNAMRDAIGQVSQYLELDTGPFPRRRHSHLLTARFALDYFAMLARYARWAEAEIKRWPELPPQDHAFLGRGLRELRAAVDALQSEFDIRPPPDEES